jgi:hypothetical protein
MFGVNLCANPPRFMARVRNALDQPLDLVIDRA